MATNKKRPSSRKPETRTRKQKTIMQQLSDQNDSLKKLAARRDRTMERMRKRFAGLETHTYAALAKEFGIDPERIRQKYEPQFCDEHIKIRKEIEKERALASSIMTRRKRVYERSLEKYMRMGFRKSMDAFHHNPTIRFKLAHDWDISAPHTGGHDPREGLSRNPGARAEAGLVLLDGGALGPRVNELHPLVTADVGSRERFGHANARVDVTLRFEQPAPKRTTYVYQEYLAMDCRGFGAANASDAWFFTMTNVGESGGRASINMSMRVMQNVRRRDTREDIMVEAFANHSISEYNSTGATFLLLGIPIPGMDPPVWGPFEAESWMVAAQPFVLFNESSGGGPVRVEVEFNLKADAKHRASASEIRFDQSGYGIKIREIGLRGTEL